MTASKAQRLSSSFRSAVKTTLKDSFAAEEATIREVVSSVDASTPSTSTAVQTPLRGGETNEMTVGKAQRLSSLFRSAVKTTFKASFAAEDANLREVVSSVDASTPSTSAAIETPLRRSTKVPKWLSRSKNSARRATSGLASGSLKLDTSCHSDDSINELSEDVSSILCGGTTLAEAKSPDPQDIDDKNMESILEKPWFSTMSYTNLSLRRKEVSRDRKQKWIFRNTQEQRIDRLVGLCAKKLGADAAVKLFGKLGRETGIKEYNALIHLCIERARETEDEEDLMEQIDDIYQLFEQIREQGFQLEEETYGPILMLLIDMKMEKECLYFFDAIHGENQDSISILAYYEMLLWIKINDQHKIKERCDYIAANDTDDKFNIKGNSLLALLESDRMEELLQLLEIIDITKFSSVDHLINIFRSLGRLSLESFIEKFILELKSSGFGEENISNFIYSYAVSLPNLVVEDIISKFRYLHGKLEVTPSSTSYEKLIEYCCDALKVHVALDITDQMFQEGLTLSMQTIQSILYACNESCDYNLVRRIYSLICDHHLKPNSETFRSMINLSVKMKDFEGAYNMIKDMEKMHLMPTASVYNAIMAGYFREKNTLGGLMVLKQMEDADVKPDSQTFSYLIGNSDREENIIKYYEEMKQSGVPITKYVFMALINAYAACGRFEKAKQVIVDEGVPVKYKNEIKSVLISALATHGLISDALSIYEEMKQAECTAEPKAILCLIEHLQSEGELTRLLHLLKDVHDPDYWIDGCFRVIAYCVRYKYLSSTVDLLKQLKDKICHDDVATEVIFDEIFSKIAETEPADVQFGLKLLEAIKQELDVQPSRKCLDFLLTACASAKDLPSSLIIWKEYPKAGLPYNVLSFLRLYQVHLASGQTSSAQKLLNKIPKDDPHVRCIIQGCMVTYLNVTSTKEKTKKKK
ncbi:hypothetical protein NMG60_11037205 [Bertholletia excelsa]